MAQKEDLDSLRLAQKSQKFSAGKRNGLAVALPEARFLCQSRCAMAAALPMVLLVEENLAPGSILPPEDEATGSVMVFMFIIAGLVGVAAWLIFVWAVKDRQFDEIEDIAQRVSDLDNHDTTGAAEKYQAERAGGGNSR